MMVLPGIPPGSNPPLRSRDNLRMSFTVFLGNLPAWVTADDIRGWLAAENLVADAIKVIRNPETQESKGFAFIEAPNTEEMNSIIRRFDRAPLEDRLLRANPAQPPKPRVKPGGRPWAVPEGLDRLRCPSGHSARVASGPSSPRRHSVPKRIAPPADANSRPPRATARGRETFAKRSGGGPQSAFAEELAKAL